MSRYTFNSYTKTPYYAHDDFGEKAVKGKIVSATAQIYEGDQVLFAEELPKNVQPFQVNNVSEWFRRIAIYSKVRPMIEFLRSAGSVPAALTSGRMEFLINNGEGIKEGRGRSETRFTFLIKEANLKVDLIIRTSIYSAEYYQKKKALAAQGKPHGYWLEGTTWMEQVEFGNAPVDIKDLKAAGLQPGPGNIDYDKQ